MHHVQSSVSQRSFIPLPLRTEQSWQIKLQRLRALIRVDEKQSNCTSDNIMNIRESMAEAAEQTQNIKSMSPTAWAWGGS